MKFGSKVYGTDNVNSDDDIKFVYVQTPEDLFINGYKPFIQVDKDNYGYELSEFVNLLKKNNPTCLELLFTPDEFIIEKHPYWDILTKHKDEILTKNTFHSFASFANAQLQKAKNVEARFLMETNEVLRKTPLDFCYVLLGFDEQATKQGLTRVVDFLEQKGLQQTNIIVNKIDKSKEVFALYFSVLPTKGICDENSTQLRLTSSPKNAKPIAYMVYNEDAYRSHCKKYKEYQEWLENRNPQRYKDIVDANSKIDVKNAYHTIRMLNMCIEILSTNTMNVDRRGIDADFLKRVRQGEISLELLEQYTELELKKAEKFYKKSMLPESNVEILDKLLLQIKTQILKK